MSQDTTGGKRRAPPHGTALAMASGREKKSTDSGNHGLLIQ